jgi:hypothetical protein
MEGSVRGPVRTWLRVEGLAALVLSTSLYARGDFSWTLFALLFFVPDVSFAGYLAGPRVGALVYNAAHSYIGPVMVILASLATGRTVALPLIWFAHIGFDRALGYGLKYSTGFGHTHLGRIGKRQGNAERRTANSE